MISTSTNIQAARQIQAGWTPQDSKIGSPEGLVHDPNSLDNIPGSLVLVIKDCGDYLERKYPGWVWMLQPNLVGRVVNLFSYRCSKEWGIVMHLDKLSEVDDRKKLMTQYCGELLERFGMPRKPFEKCIDHYMSTPKNFKGEIDADLGSVTLTRQQKLDLAVREGRTTFYQDRNGQRYMRLG